MASVMLRDQASVVERYRMHAASVSRLVSRRRRRSTASSAAAIAAGTPKTSAVPQCWREVRARIDSRSVSRICIVSVAMTTATGAAPGAPSSASCRTSRDRRRARLAMIAAARAPARGATNAWGMAYLFVKSLSCTSLLDWSQQRPAHGTRSSSRRRRDIFASAGNDDRSNDGQRLDHGHLEPAMAADALVFPSLNTADGRTQRRT